MITIIIIIIITIIITIENVFQYQMTPHLFEYNKLLIDVPRTSVNNYSSLRH